MPRAEARLQVLHCWLMLHILRSSATGNVGHRRCDSSFSELLVVWRQVLINLRLLA